MNPEGRHNTCQTPEERSLTLTLTPILALALALAVNLALALTLALALALALALTLTLTLTSTPTLALALALALALTPNQECMQLEEKWDGTVPGGEEGEGAEKVTLALTLILTPTLP